VILIYTLEKNIDKFLFFLLLQRTHHLDGETAHETMVPFRIQKVLMLVLKSQRNPENPTE